MTAGLLSVNSYWFRSVDERAGRRDSFSCAWVRYQTRVTRKIASGSGISKPPRWELLYKRRVRGIVNLRMAEVKRKRFAFANWTRPKRGNQVPASFGIMVGVPVVDEGRGFVAAGPVSRILPTCCRESAEAVGFRLKGLEGVDDRA